MTLEQIKKKWVGVQSAWKEGCFFFALLTILDENDIRYDLWDVTHFCIKQGYMQDDGYILDSCGLLFALTGKHYEVAIVSSLPAHIPSTWYTVEKWYNERTGYTHFRRRFVDTLKDSVTVSEGSLVAYYIFKEV